MMSRPTGGYAAHAVQDTKQQRDQLIMSHLALVRHVVGKLLARLPEGIDEENLEAAGTLGLVEAAQRFDATRGIKFETFAYPRIRGAVLDELRRNCPLPQDLLERIARLRKIYQQATPPVTVEKLVELSGMDADEVQSCLSAMRLTHMTSLSGDPGEYQVACPQDSPEAILELAEYKKTLAEGVAALPEKERIVVTLYYLEDLRLKEIGVVLKLSESRVCRMLNGALFRLGEYMKTREMGGK